MRFALEPTSSPAMNDMPLLRSDWRSLAKAVGARVEGSGGMGAVSRLLVSPPAPPPNQIPRGISADREARIDRQTINGERRCCSHPSGIVSPFAPRFSGAVTSSHCRG